MPLPLGEHCHGLRQGAEVSSYWAPSGALLPFVRMSRGPNPEQKAPERAAPASMGSGIVQGLGLIVGRD